MPRGEDGRLQSGDQAVELEHEAHGAAPLGFVARLEEVPPEEAKVVPPAERVLDLLLALDVGLEPRPARESEVFRQIAGLLDREAIAVERLVVAVVGDRPEPLLRLLLGLLEADEQIFLLLAGEPRELPAESVELAVRDAPGGRLFAVAQLSVPPGVDARRDLFRKPSERLDPGEKSPVDFDLPQVRQRPDELFDCRASLSRPRAEAVASTRRRATRRSWIPSGDFSRKSFPAFSRRRAFFFQRGTCSATGRLL